MYAHHDIPQFTACSPSCIVLTRYMPKRKEKKLKNLVKGGNEKDAELAVEV